MTMSVNEGRGRVPAEALALQVEDLHCYYGKAHVVRGLDFSVGAGQGMALLGRNGAGKSTTMKAVMGLLLGTAGRVHLHGKSLAADSAHARARQGLALVFEDRRVFPGLTVSENLQIAKKGASTPLTLDEVYDMFPLLADMRERDAGTLSGGEQQMLAIARAVRPRPTVLLLDEPSEGLAPKIVDDLVVRIQQLRQQLGLAVVVAEHKQWFSREVTETMAVLASESGRTVFHGAWADFDERPEVAERYLSLGAGA